MKLHDMTSPWGFLRTNILLILLTLCLAMVSGSYLGHADGVYVRDGGSGEDSRGEYFCFLCVFKLNYGGVL